MNKRIAHITQFYYPVIGGQQLYIKYLVDAFEKKFEQTVIQGWLEKANTENTINLPNLGSQIESRIGKHFPYFSWYRSSMGLRLKKKLLKSFDKLILHYPFFYPPVKWHNEVIIISHGVLWNRPLKTITDRRFLRLARETRGNATIIANDTDYLREIGIKAKPGVKGFQEIEKNVFYFPNCVDTNLFSPSEVRKEDLILVPRNMRPDRGIHLAIEAFSLLKDKLKSYRMLIVGAVYKGSPYYNECMSLIKKNGLEERILLHQSVTQTGLIDFYRKARVTVIPSLNFEGTSLSALESMACGTPVVSTETGGLKDLPCLHAESNAEDLSKKIKLATDNTKTYADEQIETVRTGFNLGLWKDNWERILKR